MTTIEQIKPRTRKMKFAPEKAFSPERKVSVKGDEDFAIIQEFDDFMNRRDTHITRIAKQFKVTRAMVYKLHESARLALQEGQGKVYQISRMAEIMDSYEP
jgi:uncharacterized FAD-dependent dehydrogenase